METNTPVVYTEFRGWGEHHAAMGESIFPIFYIGFYIGEIKNLAFLKLENFQKSMQNLQYFEYFTGNFAIFQNFYRNFRKNLGDI